MSRIYVASSWRNPHQPTVVKALGRDHEVYDFRHPDEGDDGFHWSEIDPDWETWTRDAYRQHLDHPVARAGFGKDMAAMEWADTFVLVLPCGRSAHLELGWAVGRGKRTAILIYGVVLEPELMYQMVDKLALSTAELREWLDGEVAS
jgi:hypothetical protein